MSKQALELTVDRDGLIEFLMAYANVKRIHTADVILIHEWVSATESLVTKLQEREQ